MPFFYTPFSSHVFIGSPLESYGYITNKHQISNVKFRLNEKDQLLVMTFIQNSFDPDAFEAPATPGSSRNSDAALSGAGKSLRMNKIRIEIL